MSSWMLAMSGLWALACHLPMLTLRAYWLSMNRYRCLGGHRPCGSDLDRASARASRSPWSSATLFEVSPSEKAAESTREPSL